jgi:protein-disulfide isomerase
MSDRPSSARVRTVTAAHWYTRWWGIPILLLVLGLLIGVVYFFWLTFGYYNKIQTGEINLDAYSNSESVSTSKQLVQSEERSTTPTSVDNFADDPSVGPEDAVLTIVAFEDFQCPFCLQEFPIFRAAMEKYKDQVRFVYRDFPLTDVHPQAQKAAEAGQCAHEHGVFWEYHDKLFSHQNRLSVPDLKQYAREVGVNGTQFDSCLDSGKYTQEVESDVTDGLRAGVLGTPTFFFNGHKLQGVITEEGFDTIIEYFLKQE